MATYFVEKWETVSTKSYIEVEADNEFDAIAEAQERESEMCNDGAIDFIYSDGNDDEWIAYECVD